MRRLFDNLLEIGVALSVSVAAVVFVASEDYVLALAPAAGIVGLIFLFRYPEAGFYLLMFLVPFAEYRAGLPKLLGGVLVALIVAVAIIDKHRKFHVRSNMWIWIGALFVAFGLSAMMSPFTNISMDHVRKIATAISIFLLTMVFVRPPRQFAFWMPAVFAVAATVSSALGVFAYIFRIDAFALREAVLYRVTGGMANPNHFAALVIFCLPFIAHFIYVTENTGRKLFLVSALALNLAAVVLTFSRMGSVILVVTCGIIAFNYARHITPRRLGLFFAGATAALAILLVVLPESYYKRLGTIVNDEDSSRSHRLSYLKVAYDSVTRRPVLGVGPGTFPILYAISAEAEEHRRYSQTFEDMMRSAHNTYAEILVGAGLLGLTAFLLVFFQAFKNYNNAVSIARLKGNEDAVSLVRAYRAAFLSISVYFLFLTSPYHKYYWAVLALSQLAVFYVSEGTVESFVKSMKMGNRLTRTATRADYE